MSHDDRRGSVSRNNTWIIVLIVAFLAAFGIWLYASQDNPPTEPNPTPVDGSEAPGAPAVTAQ